MEKELRSYLSCGLLGEGFVRCVCRSCGDEILETGVDATDPPIAKARARPHQEHFDLHPEDTGVDPQIPD
jgi:hypothetical protein